GLGYRSDLSPLQLWEGGWPPKPGPRASCPVTSHRNFHPGASPRSSAPVAPLLPHNVP
ncbi:hypothetical protein DBR06_SOUSAS14010035, partial [Sousa chinensis]